VAELPTGTVTFLFTDVEGSTRLLHELGDAYADALREHRKALRECFGRHGGVEVDTQGDAFFVAFAKASEALAAAAEGTMALSESPLKVRMGLHTGEPIVTDEGYVGIDVHRAARIAAAGHGGQILVSQSTYDLLRADGLRDLGEHRLKDLTPAERIYQFGEEHFPPLKTLNATNLPLPSDPLVGRKKELADVLRLLRLEGARLISVTGPGGIGKTRFAVAVAEELVTDFDHGVWFVDLSSIGDAKLVGSTIAAALGAKDELATHIADHELLLLLDNFEHVTAAAGEVASLLSSCPGLCVLVTTRERLQVGGEQECALRPLPDAPAVELFRQRASAKVPEFEGAYDEIAEICRRVDGLPLAIELAAARVKVLPPSELLAQLEQRLPILAGGRRDVPERQRTLRATIEWSYDLLSADEQLLFTRLAIFVGGFTFAAAEAVCEADLDTLEALVEQSLVRRSEGGRLAMLETIREYASDQLAERGADRAAQRHAHFFAELVEAIAEDLSTGRHEAMEAIAADYSNIRQALGWLRTTEPPTFVGTVTHLSRFWIISAELDEGRRWLELAVAAADSPDVRSTALGGLISVAFQQGDVERAEQLCQERLECCRALGDIAGVIRGTGTLGSIAAHRRDFATADALIAEAITLAENSGDDWAVATGLINRMAVATESGDWPAAKTLSKEALIKAQEVGDEEGIAIALWSLGFFELREGRLEEARPWLAESLQVCVSLHATRRIADCLLALAVAAGENKEGERAARLLAKAETLRQETGGPWEGVDIGLHANATHAVATQLATADAAVAWSQGEAMSLEAAVDYALAEID
jgi:predicted ATPase